MIIILSTFTPFVFQKENEKAVDELRKFYSAQAVKHKENMDQAVNHKVSGLQPAYCYMIYILGIVRETVGLNGVLDNTGLTESYSVWFSA